MFFQDECARVLLFRGADKTVMNNFHEDAFFVATSSGHSNLAEIIRCFRRDDVGEWRYDIAAHFCYKKMNYLNRE